jgi:exodeoxyribonuclease-3
MKIITWNVNGIRACINNGFYDYFKASNADVFCMQEIKCQNGQVNMYTPEYQQYWNYALQAGYAGTALFTKVNPVKAYKDLISDEGRVITVEYDKFYLINVYVPNAGARLNRLEYREKWDNEFLSLVLMLEETKPVIICGDMNVAHENIDLARWSENTSSAGFTWQERTDFSTLLNAGYVDAFRYLYNDMRDMYTYWSYRGNARERNVGWRLDYFLVSNKLIDKVESIHIASDIYGSDHCPVELVLSI